jgi:urease accessory protein
VLWTGPDSARVALVATSALLLAGDHVTVDVEVGERCRLEIVDVAGTVAYHARGGCASWSTRIRVATGARLVWLGEPLVVADGSDVRRTTDIQVASEAAAVLRETIVLGRSGERGGAIDIRSTATVAGSQLLVERLDLADRVLRERAGMIGPAKVVDSALYLGLDHRPHGPTADADRPLIYRLPGPGLLARSLHESLHLSRIGRTASQWARHALSVAE